MVVSPGLGERDTSAIRVLLVEDDAVLRRELERAITRAGDLVLAGAFGTGRDALAFTGEAEVALVDLGLPDTTGSDLIRALRAARPELDVLVHTVAADRATVFEAIVAGASSYVLKGVPPDQLLAAVRELRAGGAPMSPKIARDVIAAFRQQGTVAERYALSARERDVLRGLEDGLSYKEVASELHLSTHTVHSHIKRIYEKLHASSKAEALAKARLRGML